MDSFLGTIARLVQRAVPLGLHGEGVSDTTKSLAYVAGSPGQGSGHMNPSVDSALETLRRRENDRCDIGEARRRTH